MNNVKVYKYIIWCILFSIVFSIISICWIDFWLYHFINRTFDANVINQEFNNEHSPWAFLTSVTSLSLFIGCVFLVMIANRLKDGRFISKLFLNVYLIANLFLLMEIKGLLKYVFARCVPTICYINDSMRYTNKFGFAWFREADGFISFPSGHCMVVSYFLMWVVIFYPSAFYGAISLLCLFVMVMVAFNFHFLGDCFAGIAVGLSFGLASFSAWLYIWQRVINKNGRRRL